ncbi:hypothetical protein L0244_30590 [bacterium]|nr:hypothetical protein [bacterium]MCI0696407.1 hypothetical protein [candidate division KSB1 bacterium]
MLEQPIEMLLICGIVIGMLHTFIQLLISFHEINKSSKQAPAGHFCPPVSILKPLKGLDDQLEKNLQSFFQLDYPEYELIFGLQQANDPAYSVVSELCAKHPHIKSCLIVNQRRIGLNPKINNLPELFGGRLFHEQGHREAGIADRQFRLLHRERQ